MATSALAAGLARPRRRASCPRPQLVVVPTFSSRLPKRSIASACATSAPSSRGSGSSSCRAVRVERVAASSSSAPAAQPCGHRREDVAPVERRGDRLEPVGRAAMSTAILHAAAALARRAQQAVVGPDEQATVPGAQGERAAPRADLGIDDREVNARRAVGERVAQHERARRTSCRGIAVREVDRRGTSGRSARSRRGRRRRTRPRARSRRGR